MVLDESTVATRLARVLFSTFDDLTPLFFSLIDQFLPKVVVTPRQHISGSLATNLATLTMGHLACLERRNVDDVKVVREVVRDLPVCLRDQVAHAHDHPLPSASHPVQLVA